LAGFAGGALRIDDLNACHDEFPFLMGWGWVSGVAAGATIAILIVSKAPINGAKEI
jgi:hypothetical protein